jgi:AraC-like DNA-binding protein
MSSELPHISFQTKSPEINGIEILRLEDLMAKMDLIKPDPSKAHQLKFYMLVYFREGTSEHLVDFVWHDIEPNSLIYLTSGQVNAFRLNKDQRGYVLLFTEAYFKEQLNKLQGDTIVRLFSSHLFSPQIQLPESSNVAHYLDLLYQEFYKEDTAFNKKNIVDYLYHIVFSKLEAIKQDETRELKDSRKLRIFLDFKSLLEKHFHESRNADFYAEKLHMTYKHLNATCKDIIQTTAKQFIDHFIILESKRQLINTAVKSTELAYSMGFEDPGNFIKYFKKHTGLTPNGFKKSYK